MCRFLTELIFGSSHYTTAIDIWSTACVMAELMLGTPIFPGASPLDQIVEIIKVLGTPTPDEIMSMNPKYDSKNFPQVEKRDLHDVFGREVPDAALTLLGELFSYTPKLRPGGIKVLSHEFFNALREPSAKLPNGRPLPRDVYLFSQWELACKPSINHILKPAHVGGRDVPDASPTLVDLDEAEATSCTTDKVLVAPGRMAPAPSPRPPTTTADAKSTHSAPHQDRSNSKGNSSSRLPGHSSSGHTRG